MSTLDDLYRLTDAECADLGITRAQADQYAGLARGIGPLNSEQRDRLTILLRPTRLARGA